MNRLKKLQRRVQYLFKKKMYPDVIRHEWLVKMCYVDMFRKAGGDFNCLVENATINECGEKDIPFMDYEIKQKDFDNILRFYQSFIKENYWKRALSNQIHLGCSPKIV
ncbi:hypothetical protein [uncultured Mediterranean phage]|nr:hypothetical protein [uncultured Mediterranean phage]